MNLELGRTRVQLLFWLDFGPWHFGRHVWWSPVVAYSFHLGPVEVRVWRPLGK